MLIITDRKNHSNHYIAITKWLTDNLIQFLEANPEGFKSSDIGKSLLTASQYLGYRILSMTDEEASLPMPQRLAVIIY